MKNYKLYSPGDEVIIIRTHKDDLNKKGIIIEVNCSYCKIKIGDKVYNHTYAQFKKVNKNEND